MVDWANIYFAGKIAFAVAGTLLQLTLVVIIWINGRFKK